MATPNPRPAPIPRSTFRRHSPKVGARCVKAHAGICAGGRPLRAVPTATLADSGAEAAGVVQRGRPVVRRVPDVVPLVVLVRVVEGEDPAGALVAGLRPQAQAVRRAM